MSLLLIALALPARAEPEATPPAVPASVTPPTAAAAPPVPPETRFTWVAIPNASYDVDDGFGAGARAELDWYKPGYSPYQLAFVTQAFLTTNGYHHHRVRFDAPGLGPKHTLRLTGHFAYRQWLNDGYWGMGNATTLDRGVVDGTSANADKRYRYTLIQPFARLTLRGELGGPWAWFAFVAGRWSDVETYSGSLLAEEAPLGMVPGFGVQPGLGVLFDTREPELTPDRGALLELSVRGMPRVGAAEAEWVAVFASARAFWTLGPKVVFGSRLMGEAMFGDVPFYDLNTWGGLTPMMGFGGSDTLRGVSFGRYHDLDKAVWNNELRIDVGSQTLLHRELRWQVVPFFDLGMVWGSEPVGDVPLHPGLGVGIHPIVEGTFVGRLDVALGLDEVEEPDGSRTPVPNPGVYVVFDHMF